MQKRLEQALLIGRFGPSGQIILIRASRAEEVGASAKRFAKARSAERATPRGLRGGVASDAKLKIIRLLGPPGRAEGPTQGRGGPGGASPEGASVPPKIYLKN